MENFIPKSYKNNIIANKLTWFQNKWITFALTTDNCILEFEKPFGNLEIGIQNLYKLNKIQKPISTNELQFKILHTLQGEILLLLKVFNHLLVIKRVPSSLELIFYEKNIDKFRLSLRSNDLNDVILYYTSINGAIKKTSLCQLCKISTSSSIDSTLIQNYLHKERQVRRSRLDMAQKNRLLKLCRLVEKHKFLPKISRISCDFDVTPLVRFGSMFMLVYMKLIYLIFIFLFLRYFLEDMQRQVSIDDSMFEYF